MSEQRVILDADDPTCIGVHYAVGVVDAKAHFESCGFRGISHIEVMDRDLNCNEARRRALDAARRGEGKCYWNGNWDYSANHCNLWLFRFKSYDGPTFGGPATPDTKAHVDWRGN